MKSKHKIIDIFETDDGAIVIDLDISNNNIVKGYNLRKEKEFHKKHPYLKAPIVDIHRFILANKNTFYGMDQEIFTDLFKDFKNTNGIDKLKSMTGLEIYIDWKSFKYKNCYFYGPDGFKFCQEFILNYYINNKRNFIDININLNKYKTSHTEHYQCAKEVYNKIISKTQFNAIVGECQVGKTSFKIILSLLLLKSGFTPIIISSFNRKDANNKLDPNNLLSLSCKFSIPYFNLYDKGRVDECLQLIKNLNNVVLIHDESDYGTEKEQLFSSLFEYCIKNNLYYCGVSATNLELIKSGIKNLSISYLTSPMGFKNMSYYYNKGLCKQSIPFFNSNYVNSNLVSNQGKQALEHMFKYNNGLGVIRLAGRGNKKEDGINFSNFKSDKLNQSLETYCFKEFGKRVKVEIISEENDYNFGKNGDWEKTLTTGGYDYLILIVHQKFTRSTAAKFHHLWRFYHDHRSNFEGNALIQALGRIHCYNNSLLDILIYSDLETIKFMTTRMTEKDAQNYHNKLSSRIGKKTNNVDKLRLHFEASRLNGKLPDKNLILKVFKEQYPDYTLYDLDLPCFSGNEGDITNTDFKDLTTGVGWSHSNGRDPDKKCNTLPKDVINGLSIRSSKSENGVVGYIFDGPYFPKNLTNQQAIIIQKEYDDLFVNSGYNNGDVVMEFPLKEESKEKTSYHNTKENSVFTI